MTNNMVDSDFGSPHLNVKYATVFILLTLLLLLIYSNTFDVPFHFDDKPNIITNQLLHVTDLKPSSLWQTFFAKAGKDEFFRPIPSLTLALNWYVGKDNPFGYHVVNILIHILTAYFLFLASKTLLQTPKIKQQYDREGVYFIAVLSAVLWAVNPIQIQAVTYIVQRMASMAAMFSILGIYFYLKGRIGGSHRDNLVNYGACFISCFLAIMSKQNAVLVLPSLVLIEILFFEEAGTVLHKVKGRFFWISAIGIIAIMIAIAANLQGIFTFIEAGYATRPFTLTERVLTQPRIVLFYISQIFYPLPSRLSIAHDIAVSKSLFTPWSTLPAMSAILLLVSICIYKRKAWPLVSFSVLFFFLNHLVESTFLPLELIFEHRNYIPSFFLFLPIASVIWSLLKRYRSRSFFMYTLIISFVTLIVIGLGNFTFIRNHAWKTESTLWHDAMRKAPQQARPFVFLGIKFAWDPKATVKEYDIAMAMFRKAIPLHKPRIGLTSSILNNMGLIYYKRGEYQKAVNLYRKALSIDPDYLKMRYDLISSLIMLGKFNEGNIEANKLIDNPKNFQKPDYFMLKGFILLWLDKPDEALAFFDKALEMEPDNKAVMLNKGVALGRLGESQKAAPILKKAIRLAKGDIRPYYALIENNVREGDLLGAERNAEIMLNEFSVRYVIATLDELAKSVRTAPMDAELIYPVVKKVMQGRVAALRAVSSAAQTACGL